MNYLLGKLTKVIGKGSSCVLMKSRIRSSIGTSPSAVFLYFLYFCCQALKNQTTPIIIMKIPDD